MIATLWEDRRYVAVTVAGAVVTGAAIWVSPWLSVLLALSVAIGTVGLLHPVVMVPVVFAGMLWSNAGLFDVPIVGVPITLAKLSMVGALFTWLVHVSLYRRALFRWNELTIPLLAAVGVMTVSLTWALEITRVHGVYEIVGLATLIVMLHWQTTVLTPKSLPMVLRACALILIPIMAWTLFTTPTMESYRFYEFERAAGVYDNANYWCGILLLVTPLLIGFFARDEHWSAPWLLAAIAVLLPLNVFVSLSRSGFIAMIGVSPFLLYLLRNRKLWLVAGLAVFAFLFPYFVDIATIARRYQSLLDPTLIEIDGSLVDRAIAARAAIELFLDHPFLGVGVGMFRRAATAATSGAMVVKTPHNTYLWIASEQGLLGLTVHAWLFYRIGRRAWRNVRMAHTPAWKSAAIGFLASMVAAAIMAMTAGFMTFPFFYLLLGFGLVMGDAVAPGSQTEHPPPGSEPTPRASRPGI
ncbi:MAG: O-antigen ligase family protein [Deltaproteobacteria bacterium]|nr:O-antigen ligase family protein [Deltaproteobacteria bacterium]MBW2253270.1 O-antigen ligase family protein [Deltaproteobacteria bacterium]